MREPLEIARELAETIIADYESAYDDVCESKPKYDGYECLVARRDDLEGWADKAMELLESLPSR